MPKFRIYYGLSHVDEGEEIIEAETLEQAQEEAYRLTMETVESWITYGAEPAEEDEES